MEINKEICPLCGKENGCAYQKGLMHEKCWCQEIRVPQELRDRIPEDLKGKVCICRDCVEQFLEKQD